MDNKLRWWIPIILGVIFIIAIIILQNSAHKMVSRIEKFSEPENNDQLEIVVTLDDNRYHRSDCARIRGEQRVMSYGAAREYYVAPCPFCFPQDYKIYIEE